MIPRAPRALPAALLALLASLAPLPGRAAVEGSPHDLISQGYDVVKVSASQERCNRCHLSVSAADQGFLPPVPPVLEGRWEEGSLLCFSCHDGTTIVSPDVDASQSAFHPAAHGSNMAGYEGIIGEKSGLAHIGEERMECLTCHDPHDNSHRPFLRVGLEALCLVCHARYAELGRGLENRSGSHPMGMTPGAVERKEVPLAVGPGFRIPFPSPYPLQKGKGSIGTHWLLGGHLEDGAGGQMACFTCHAVHGEEEAPPRRGLLTVDPDRGIADLFCEGCHTGERGDGLRTPAKPNPGGTITGRTYHPADDDVANGEGRLLEVKIPAAWPLGGGDPARLLCSTCHTAHGAKPATPILRPPVEVATFCESCHDKIDLLYHHPLPPGETRCKVPAGETIQEKGFRCELCHRAHNAGLDTKNEAAYIPLLRYDARTDDLCTVCHPKDNPTCSPDENYRASHFLGDPTAPAAYRDAEPPLRREPWPESGLRSRFGGKDEKSVLCLSCHAFRKGAVVSGDGGKARYLLARSGNPVEWLEGGETVYLCTGCHSASPGTGTATKGHTHPLMNARISALTKAPAVPVSVTGAGRINCDSCHRPHEAISAAGYYILEMVTGANLNPVAIHPKIDYTVLCYRCHDAQKY